MTSENLLRGYLRKIQQQLVSNPLKEYTIRVPLFPFTPHKPFAAQTYERLRNEHSNNSYAYKEWRSTITDDRSKFDVGERDGVAFKTNYFSDYSDSNILEEYGLLVLLTSPRQELPPTSRYNTYRPNVETANPIFGFRIRIDDGVYLNAENENGVYRFYVELEKREEINIDALIRACCMFRETAYIYTKSQYRNVVHEFLRLLGLNVPLSQGVPYIPSLVFYHASDVTYEHLLSGDIINRVRIGYKTDGFRRALYCRDNEIWLLYANSASLVSLKNNPTLPRGLILDGEYVPANRRRTHIIESLGINATFAFHYIAYDVLAYPGRSNPPAPTHRDRMNLLPPAGKFTTVGFLMFIKKQFFDFTTLEELFNHVKILEEKAPNSIYLTDGYIFISNDITYTYTTKGNRPTNKHTILKWKPRERLTIDLTVKPASGGMYEVVGINDVRPVDLTDLGETIPPDAIVEFRMEDGVTNGDAFHLVPEKLRIDKDNPNTSDEINRLIRLFRDPITIDVLRGESMRVVQHFHQREYQHLISTGIAKIGTGKKYAVHLGIPSCFTTNEWIYALNDFTKVIVLDSHNTLTENELYVMWPQYDARIIITHTMDETSAAVAALFPGKQSHVIASLFSPLSLSTESLISFVDNALHPQGVFLWAHMEGAALHRYFDISPSIEVIANNRILYSLEAEDDTYTSYVTKRDGVAQNSQTATNLAYVNTPYVYIANLEDSLFANSTTQRLGNSSFLNSYERFYSALFTSGVYESKTPLTTIDVVSQDELGVSVRQEEITTTPVDAIAEDTIPTQGVITTERRGAAHTLPLTLIRRFIGPFAVVGYYRHVPGVGENLEGLYAAVLGSFFQDYYRNPHTYVEALMATFGDPSIHIIAFELHISIILVNVLNELIDQVILEGRPVVVICIAFDRVSGRRYYEIVSRAQERGTRVMYETVFSPQDSFVTAQRLIANVDIAEEPWLVRLPSIHRARTPKSSVVGTYNIASSEIAGIVGRFADNSTQDLTSLRLALGASGFDEEIPYFPVDKNASLVSLIANVSDAVRRPFFVIGWSMRRFDDYHIALLAAISDVFDLTLLFDSAYNTWLVGETLTSDAERDDLSNYIALLGIKRAALDPAALARNANFVGVIRSILQRIITLYNPS